MAPTDQVLQILCVEVFNPGGVRGIHQADGGVERPGEPGDLPECPPTVKAERGKSSKLKETRGCEVRRTARL